MAHAIDSRRIRLARWLLCCAISCSPDTVAVVGSFDAGARPERDGSVSESCLGRTAAQSFQHALCACGDVALATGGLSSDAFDSRQGPYSAASASPTGDVGIHGALAATETFADTITVGGSLTVEGPLGPVLLPTLSIGRDLRVAGSFSYSRAVEVGGDLWLEGGLDGAATLHVAGDLRQPASAMRRSSAAVTIDGQDLRVPVRVAAPCACGDPSQDIAALVADARLHNDNAATSFDADSLADVIATRRSVLDGARIFVSSIGIGGHVVLIANGKTALFVNGAVEIGGILQLEIGPAGSLDVFVAGNFTELGEHMLASSSRPAQLRIYVAREQRVTIGLPGGFAGNLYAPQSDVFMTGTSAVYGSLFARNFSAATPLSLHYDSSIRDAGDSCLSQ